MFDAVSRFFKKMFKKEEQKKIEAEINPAPAKPIFFSRKPDIRYSQIKRAKKNKARKLAHAVRMELRFREK